MTTRCWRRFLLEISRVATDVPTAKWSV
jgi:hypothetical protein